MMCGMCESHVNEAVRKAFPEVKRASSSQAKVQTVIHSEQPLDEQKLRDAINATGYEVKGVSPICFVVTLIMYYGGTFAMLALIALAIFLLVRSNIHSVSYTHLEKSTPE